MTFSSCILDMNTACVVVLFAYLNRKAINVAVMLRQNCAIYGKKELVVCVI